MFINSIYPKHPDTNNEASNGQQQKLFPGHHFNYDFIIDSHVKKPNVLLPFQR